MPKASWRVLVVVIPLAATLVIAGNLLAILGRPLELNPGDGGSGPAGGDSTVSPGNSQGPGAPGTGGGAGGAGGSGGGSGGGPGAGGGGPGTGGGTNTSEGTGGGAGAGSGSGPRPGGGGKGGGEGSGESGGAGANPSGSGGVGPGAGGTGGATDGSQSPGVFQDTPVGKVFAGVLVALLGAFIVLLIYYFLLVFRGYRRGLRATPGVKAAGASLTPGQRSALVLGLRSSRAHLASATDIRREVLLAYLKMLIALEGRGLGDRPHYTCWDLHRAASRVLGKADAPTMTSRKPTVKAP